MEEYPEELRTPPVSLISIFGSPEELTSTISSHLHTLQPPINTLVSPHINSLFSNTNNPQTTPHGIIKRDWLPKHRTRIPAVLAAFFPSHHVSGDPAQWLTLCTHLDNIKAAIRPKNIRLLIVILLSSTSTADEQLNEDQLLALRKRAELDSKYILMFNPADPHQLDHSLQRLAATFADLANAYYKEEGKRIRTRVEKKNFASVELNIRYCFKVAVYAEFRSDWVEALRFYEDAYHVSREMIGTSTRLPAIQRLIEIKTVAEQLHFKISTLLLHSGKVAEAITWFRQHNVTYRKLVGTPEAIFLHWEWMSRQFLVFAELLDTSYATLGQSASSVALGTADQSFTQWELYPAYYYQIAAHYMIEKRSSLEFALSMSEIVNEIDGNGESVVPSTYVGQFSRLLEEGDTYIMQLLTDEEYLRYALAEGKRFQDSFEIIALLRKSQESYTNLKSQRMSSYCGYQMAREYFYADDFSNAKQLFEDVAILYRKEGWVTLLWEILGYLRECSKKQCRVKGFIEYSLEMAALPVLSDVSVQSFALDKCGPAGPPSLLQRETIHREVFGLVCGDISLSSVEENGSLKITEENPIQLDIDIVSPLRVVLLASAVFHEQVIKPGVSTLITLSVLSQLPLALEIDELEIQFNQSECNFTIMNAQKSSSAASSDDGKGHRVETAGSLTLVTNKWLRLTYEIKSEKSGKLECMSVAAKMGPFFTICCQAESPASMDELSLWKYEDRVDTFPTKDRFLSFSGQRAAQVEEPEAQVEVILKASGPALVGESFKVPVTVVSKGHDICSGELKINLVDVRGGGLFSPREADISAMDSHHVELLGVTGPEGEDQSQLGSYKIEKIQQSFGLVSVPFLKNAETWSCQLEIKWHRPKPIMLYVSLGYCPQNDETSQKINIHKNLQIEGKTAVVINHHFMSPFRRDPLLPSRIKPVSEPDQLASLPVNETSVLVVSSKNCTEVPLQLLSISIEADGDGFDETCSLKHGGNIENPALLMPGEDYRKTFTITPRVNTSKLSLGTVCLEWRRDQTNKGESSGISKETSVLTKHGLPDVIVELPPLVVCSECPPYAILGDPFTYFVKFQNKTELLQEVKFSLADSQSFVLSGPHNDIVHILPKSEHILSYKLVPIVSGLQQLPRISVTSTRYSASFQPSVSAVNVFVFPSKPQFNMSGAGENISTAVTEQFSALSTEING